MPVAHRLTRFPSPPNNPVSHRSCAKNKDDLCSLITYSPLSLGVITHSIRWNISSNRLDISANWRASNGIIASKIMKPACSYILLQFRNSCTKSACSLRTISSPHRAVRVSLQMPANALLPCCPATCAIDRIGVHRGSVRL